VIKVVQISTFQSLKFRVWTLQPYWRPEALAGPGGLWGARRALSPPQELEGRVRRALDF